MNVYIRLSIPKSSGQRRYVKVRRVTENVCKLHTKRVRLNKVAQHEKEYYNNYPLTFINNCEWALTRKPADINFNGFVLFPYVQGVSERIGRVLKQQQISVSYRPQLTINSLFPRPKEQDDS